MIKESVTIDEVVAFLNEALALDKQAISQFLNRRVSVNDAILNHPTIQCRVKDSQGSLNLVGLINGLFGTDDRGFGAICYIAVEEDILKFERYPKEIIKEE